jgi:hypothetical protein
MFIAEKLIGKGFEISMPNFVAYVVGIPYLPFLDLIDPGAEQVSPLSQKTEYTQAVAELGSS